MLKKEDIIHIAQLARIGLNENEIEKYQREISLILDYFKKLEKADTNNVKPIGHIAGVSGVVREDAVIECAQEIKMEIINSFPDSRDNQVKVRSILV
jgi:aspartyl-tRNA(Asn)/glutamyl-tRNA(Gln) amidotransferase subunit C